MSSPPVNRPLRVGLISLGCAKNLVDAELMLGNLLQNGLEITNDPAAADAVIVNTCSFIDAAQEESVDTILESAEVRAAHNRGQGLIVAGCLSQRFRDELPKLLPEVDAFMGIDQVTQVTAIVRQALARRAERLQRQEADARSQPGRRKSAIAGRLAELDRPRPGEGDDSSPRLRGTEQFGQTRTVVGAGSGPAPAAPVVAVNSRPGFIPDYATPRFRLTPRHFAYVKIAEGCNHPCSFCIIPRMRGPHRSRPQPDIVAEARALLADGVKELNLISQDSTYYGLDLRPHRGGTLAAPQRFTAAVRALPAGQSTICTLLRELNALPGDFWIRLLYTHPAHWTDELIQTLAECPKVARYVDIPLQHIHDTMLERMRRETSPQHIVDLLHRIRAGIPGIALRTTFIVGFPGETDAAFQTLLDFIRATRFERLGVFTYSREEGTRAGQMAGQVPEQVKHKRRNQAMALQRKISAELCQGLVGRTLKVLAEKPAGGRELEPARVNSWEHGLIRGKDLHAQLLRGPLTLARGQADAPDIDGRVYVRGHLPPGEFATVRVLGHTDYDLIAEPAF